jgi:hypothetical protein
MPFAKTRLVVVSLASNVTGTTWPVKEIGHAVRERGAYPAGLEGDKNSGGDSRSILMPIIKHVPQGVMIISASQGLPGDG